MALPVSGGGEGYSIDDSPIKIPAQGPPQKAQIEKSSYDKGLEIDEELEVLLSQQRAAIKVVGTGGAGNNTINRITEVGIIGAEVIAINTDAQDLLYTNANKKILIGRELTKGLGAGSLPKIGEEAARRQKKRSSMQWKALTWSLSRAALGAAPGLALLQ